MQTQVATIGHTEAECQLQRIVASRVFLRAARSQRLLQYLVASALADPSVSVKEYTIATEVFGRPAGYDPAVDAAVRVEAGRLRGRLREYYAEEGIDDPIVIELPKGAYRVTLARREQLEERAIELALPVPSREEARHPSGTQVDRSGRPFAPSEVRVDPIPGAEPDRVARKARRMVRFALAAAAVCVLVGLAAWKVVRASRSHPAIQSIAVLPLRNLSGDPGQDFFADATTDELITELARTPGLRVISWNSAQQQKASVKPLQTIAHELEVDALVEGSVVRSGETVRINTQLVDARSDNHLWAGSFEGAAVTMMTLEERAAREIAKHADGSVPLEPPSRRSAQAAVEPSPAVREACLRGKNYFDKRQGGASAEQFQNAIHLDPNYAPAYAGLATALESEALLGEQTAAKMMPEALEAANKSLELDPQNGDALIARGSIAMNFLFDWEKARLDLTRGIVLSPGNSFGRMMLSLYFDAAGQPDLAIQQIRRAVEIDPLSFFMARHYGSALFYGRRYDDALRQLQYARTMHSESAVVVDEWLSAVSEKQGNYDQAVRYDLLFVSEKDRHADTRSLLSTYHQKGWKAYWALRLAQLQSDRQTDGCTSYAAALAALRAGERGQALDDLKDAARQRCFWLNVARTDPQLDDLRGNPEFEQVLAALHLPSATP